jgi:hypothetical protein
MKVEYLFFIVPVCAITFYYLGLKRNAKFFEPKPTPGKGKNIDISFFLLTGKADSDFWFWYLKSIEVGNINYLKHKLLFEMRDICVASLFVEFFDSKGIYIADWGVSAVDGNIGFDSEVNYCNKLHSTSDGFSLTRIESLTLAVKKANEIYNKNN